MNAVAERGIVYKALNKVTRKVYVGQTLRGLAKRRYEHFRQAKYKDTIYFHKALRKYGEGSFDWSILVYSDSKEELDKAERYWIQFYKATDSLFGYNQTYGGEGGLLTAEVLAKISKKKKGCIPWNKGITCSNATREKIRQANLGKTPWNKGIPATEEQKRKQSESIRGRPSAFKGKRHTAEAKRKIGLKSKGRATRKGSILTDETKQKISDALKGQHPSMATRAKLSLCRLGSKRSEETKKRMSIASLKVWEKRRLQCAQ